MADFERLAADWLSYDEALSRVLAAATPMPAESVAPEETLGRSVAASVTARATLPAWRNSAMDGYAVRSADLAGATGVSEGTGSLRLPVAGCAYPGSEPLAEVPPGAAVRIMTGAPLPHGFDTVIRVEHTDAEVGDDGEASDGAEASDDAFVVVHDVSDVGRHVRPAGQDMTEGEETVPVGTMVHSGSLPVLLASGCTAVPVFRRPRVGVLSSGDELAGLDRFDAVAAGRAVPDTNRGMIGAAVREVGGVPADLGVATDDPAGLEEKLAGTAKLDVLVATGGASMGERDLLKRVMLEHGFRLDFWRARIRPGSPMAFGRLPAGDRELPVFSLPGNPASAFVTFHVLVAPYLRAMLGSPTPAGLALTARTDSDLPSPRRMTQFYRVRLSPDAEPRHSTAGLRHPATGLRCSLTGPQGSGLVRSLRDAQGLALVPEGVGRVSQGDPVSVLLLPGAR